MFLFHILLKLSWGGAAQLGDNCSIMSGITIGAIDTVRGGGKIIIGNNVYIGSGAKLIGNFMVGDNVNIGANAVVLENVPENCTVVGVPGHIICRK